MKTKRFKQTDIGPIPEDWEVKRLGEIGEPLMCKRVLKSQTTESGEIPFYKIGTFGQKADAFISRDLFAEFRQKYSYPQKGDALISAAGTIGRVVVFDGEDAYFQDSNIVWIDNDETHVLNEYLPWLYSRTVWDVENGGSVVRLYNDNLKSTLISYPSDKAEQRRIAGALGDVDSLLATYDALIEKKRKIKVGAMQELLEVRNVQTGLTGFTGLRDAPNPVNPVNPVEKLVPRRRLPGFTGAWVEKGFDECFSLLSNNTYAREFMCADETGVANIHYGDVLIRYGSVLDFSTTHVNSLQLSVLIKSESLKDGDLIFADTAEDEMVGKAVEVRNLKDRRAVSGLHTVACRSKFEFAEGWLGYYINSPDYHNQLLPLITGTKVSSVSKAGFRQTVLHFPPTLAEQRAIAEVLSDMDAEIAELEREREKTRRIREGMMQELLTGRVRLEVA